MRLILRDSIPILCSIFLTCGCQTAWQKNVVGTYSGVILSDGVYCPAITRISGTTNGAFYGNYDFVAKGTNETGTLANLKAIAPLKLKGEWQDRFGIGDLEISFDDDFTSFSGHWNPEGGNDVKSLWYGQKVDWNRFGKP